MPKIRGIIEQTTGSGKFNYANFTKLINSYIKENYKTLRTIKGPDNEIVTDNRGKPILEKNVISIPGFCCYAKIDCEEDFWVLMQVPDRRYARLGKKLVMHIKEQMLDFLVNDKNNNYASLIGKTYFPEDEDAETISKIPDEAKSSERDINLGEELANLEDNDRVEVLKNLKELFKKK